MSVHVAVLSRSGMWRIVRRVNGFDQDICGAESEAVAWAQCAILNFTRRLG
jgi:hypothetical protein